jgi:pSer/pThr/pTyr-binding forkhead associated (FHA) protein
MPVHLLSLTDGPSILVDKPILLFGRHEECDVQLHSKKVSRRHCCVAQVNNYLVIRDLGSTNGVRVNGVRVAEGRLNPGDELTIGNFKYQVCGDVLDRSNDHPPVPKDYGPVPSENGAASESNPT